jgi:thiamine-phosphate pyrophosphorylase
MMSGHAMGLRTKAARLAAAARALKSASGAEAPFSLAFFTDAARIANPEPILRALPAGAAVVFRDYGAPRREALARRYLAIARARGVFFLVAGDSALAARIGADGAHWPARVLQSRGAGSDARRSPSSPVPGPRLPVPALITAACHDARDLARARAIGADAAFLSPAFATASHPGAEHLGPRRFRALAAGAALPVLALGGVDEMNAPLLAGANVAGLGAIGAFSG